MKLEKRLTRAKVTTADKMIRGVASVYNSESVDLGGFTEIIQRGAFKDDLAANTDVVALFNHDINALLGRTSSGTLTLSDEADGLHYSINPADTQLTRDLMVLMDRGDITGSSFSFYCLEDTVEERDGKTVRTVTKAQLVDVSPVVMPAYPASSVAVRSCFPDGLPDSILKRSQPKTKSVDGVSLPASSFAYVGNEAETDTWAFPINFPGDETKTKQHIQLAIDLWKTDKSVPEGDKPKVWEKIAAAAHSHGIALPAYGDRSWLDEAELRLLSL
ncbi:MAG TPA: HK97 family phage prohead protease [Acidobacteriaceae bacterium]|nr:HK97 family phage prohead protease [Acidobacteriaceae bacterium]